MFWSKSDLNNLICRIFFWKEDLFHKSTKKINGNIYNEQNKNTPGIKQ